jgi:rRNA maturation endonuclease Nob1
MTSHTCPACSTEYDTQDWWACPHCGDPSPDLVAERLRQQKRQQKRSKGTSSLRELLP